MISLWLPLRRARQREQEIDAARPSRKRSFRCLLIRMFWEIDVIGLVLVIAVFILILVPFTIAGASQHMSEEWGTAKILVPVLIGTVILLPLWIVWEGKTKTPFISATVSNRVYDYEGSVCSL